MQKTDKKNTLSVIGGALLIIFGLVTLIVSMVQPVFATGATQTVNVIVRSDDMAIMIDSPKPESDGVFYTDRSSFNMTVIANGVGLITIKDQNGNILWSHNKTVSDMEKLSAVIFLVGNPGEYVLTASITSANNSSEFAVAALRIAYRETAITPIPPIFPPSTGVYLNAFGRSVSLEQILSLIIYAVIAGAIIFGVIILAKRRKKEAESAE